MQAQGGAQVNRARAALLAACVIVGDQVTKAAVVATLAEGESRRLIGDVLRLTHIRNTGAAFGMFRGLGGLFGLAALVGVIVFAAIIVRRPPFWTGLGASLIGAGAIGNLIDRVFRAGGVVDFVDFRFWPAFNVADSSIFVGAFVLLASNVLDRPKPTTVGPDDRDRDGDEPARD